MQELEIPVELESFVVNVNKDYNDLDNKPKINDVTLEGNKTLEELDIQSKNEYDVKISELESKDLNLEEKITQASTKLEETKQELTDLKTASESKDTELDNKIDETKTTLSEKDNELESKINEIEENYITKDVNNLTYYKNSKEVESLLNQKADKTEIPKNISALNNDAGYVTDESIPKNVSELVNDTGYITTDNIPTKLSQLENDNNYAKVDQIPVNISELANDKEFITKLVDNLVNYYKKTEVYSKGEVNTLIEALHSVNIKKVDVLPETGENNTIYFVPTQKPQENNYYDEYMYFEDRWEKIGTTKVDFSDYTNNEQLKELLNNYVSNETFLTEIQKKLDINSNNYIKKLSIEGQTITYTRGDDTTDTLETKDTTYQDATSSSSGLMSAKDKSKLDTLKIPTKVSDLTNDTGYITEDSLPTSTSDLTNDSDFVTSADIPKKLSQLDNDSGYIKNYTESDPTVPSHVKSISESNISSWNGKAEKSEIPKHIKAENEQDALSKSTGDTLNVYYWVEES